MNILVCIKRVPATGARIVLTDDQQEILTRNLGFAISPHEECAVEEAIQIVETQGGATTVLTLGGAAADEQLRDALAMGADHGILLETDEPDWDPIATARAIGEAVRTQQDAGQVFDLLLFGNESADNGGYQVGIRVAHDLGLPCVTGAKSISPDGDHLIVRREAADGWEIFQVPLPAVVTVKEGINLPRYPPLRGRLRAKKAEILNYRPQQHHGGPEKVRLIVPEDQGGRVQFLGEGAAAVPKMISLLEDLGMV